MNSVHCCFSLLLFLLLPRTSLFDRKNQADCNFKNNKLVEFARICFNVCTNNSPEMLFNFNSVVQLRTTDSSFLGLLSPRHSDFNGRNVKTPDTRQWKYVRQPKQAKFNFTWTKYLKCASIAGALYQTAVFVKVFKSSMESNKSMGLSDKNREM